MDIGGSTAGQLPHREPWADQQDSPEGSKAPISTNLLGLEEDEPRAEEGAASGAPIAELPVRRYGDFVNPIDDPDASIFARSDPANQEQVEAPQPPPEAVFVKHISCLGNGCHACSFMLIHGCAGQQALSCLAHEMSKRCASVPVLC